jgi:hypothetical protein
MRCGRYVLALMFVCSMMISSAFSQDAMIVLNHKELGPHQRPLVQFNHEKHTETIDCLRCHHDYDKYGNNKGGEGQSCAACHEKAASEKQRIPLETAFHAQCKSCHEDLRAKGSAGGPVMCGECHIAK